MGKQAQKGRPRLNQDKIDKGTEALQQKRRALCTRGSPEDLPLTGSLLGVFYAMKVIPKSHYEAGTHFARLAYQYEGCLGHSFRARRSGLLLERGARGEELPENIEKKRIQVWRDALEVLKRAGARPYSMVMATVFYEGDLYTQGVPWSLMKNWKDLRCGLNSLESYFKKR